MITLAIDNSSSQVTGLDIYQLNKLRMLLSYTVDAYNSRYSHGAATRRFLCSKKGEFPTGLLYLVQPFLTELGGPVTTYDLRKRPAPRQGLFRLGPHPTPYPQQVNAADAVLERSRGIVVAPTGAGKSLIIALIIEKLQVRTLVVVPTLELKRQLTETLRGYFGEGAVGELGALCAVENVAALDVTVPLKGYDCVITDEYHHAAASTYRKLNKNCWTDVYHRVGLTATAFRSQSNERLLLESCLSEVIYKITYQEAVENGFIVPVEAFFFNLPKRKKVAGNTWATVYKELVVQNTDRNLLIAETMKRLRGKSTLCLVREVEHGAILSQLTGVPFASGVDGNTAELVEEFNKGGRQLIGTVGVLGEGVDTRPAEYVIVAGLGKAKTQFMQSVGRCLRRYPGKESGKVILFKDPSHKWTLTHFKEQCRILKEEYGTKEIEVK